MPRKIDPGTIKVGGGLKTSQSEPTSILGETSASFTEHVTTFSGAHTASAIEIDGHPPQFISRNVEGALDELSALIPPQPAVIGAYRAGIGEPGIPDWGILKLNDSPLDERVGALDWGRNPAETYGYYYTAPIPKIAATAYSPLGADESTDLMFNVYDAKVPGGGPGRSHAGAYTRIVGADHPAIQSLRLLPSSGPYGGQSVTLSGVLYPADKGVLTIIRWPSGGDVTDFLAQDLKVRCPAALLLGLGIASGCDGKSGGIFTLGEDSGSYDPFAFPGQATGQYDLQELHSGLSTIDGSPLPITANNRAGQVRLGTDPGAGPVVVNGITILGGGNSSIGGGSAGANSDFVNFFRYRLPYLSDYSDGILGLPYTPEEEKPRYYMTPTLSLYAGVIDLTQAGNYTNFTKDYWTFQVARYRHFFVMDDTLLPVGTPRENGTYLLLHFKTEAAFEALVRDGIAPADTDLYSRNLVNWTNPESPENIANNDPANNYPQATSYHVVRSAVFEDPAGLDAPTVTSASFTLDRNGGVDDDLVTWVSGIAYYSPVTSAGASPFRIDNLSFTVEDLFAHTYHTADPGVSAGDAYLGNMNPVVVNLAPFGYEGAAFLADFTPQRIARQRLEFSYGDLGSYQITDGPLSTDVATFSAGSLQLLGDTQNPAFSQDAKMRLFLRRPLGHEAVSTTFLPYPSVSIIPATGGKRVLFHSTKGSAGEYGNIETAVGSGVPTSYLQSPLKDTEERFLDEVYRYRVQWASGSVPVTDAANLLGPGIPSGASSINLPVRAGTAASPWDSVSWFQQRDFATELSVVPGYEAQITGLPERAPSLDYPLGSPFPSCGLLLYPQWDYSTNFRPSLADGDLTAAQWDYSGLTGDRSWTRAFDARFSRSGVPVAADGQPFVLLRISGLTLADFAYALPGPGSAAIAIFAKVPGLTTWMDIGRIDGDGPDKQDAFLDGAGCQVVGSETFDGIDAQRIVYCQVKINTGPVVNLFQNAWSEVPVLIKVTLKDSAEGRSLDFCQVPAEGNPGFLRGLVGISIVRPT